MKRLRRLVVYIIVPALLVSVQEISLAGRKKAAAKPHTETSADVRRQQENANREIRETREQIKQNDRNIQQNLVELNKISDNIAGGKVRLAESSKKVSDLQTRLSSLQNNIAANEKKLEVLRAEYLKSVKQMRIKRQQNSMLAFIFSSKNFNEAMRRIRYLREFSKWRDNKQKEITGRVEALKTQKQQLATVKTQYDKAHSENVAAQKELEKQYQAQDLVITDLRRNGEALKAHLARKQSEANTLKNRVASLIAAEQQKAEADRQAKLKAEAEQKAKAEAEAKVRAEAKAKADKEKAEQKRIAQEKADKEKAAKELAAKEKAAKDKAAKDKAAEGKKTAQKAAPKNSSPKQSQPKQSKQSESKQENNVSYAEARGRKPRSSENSGNQHKTQPSSSFGGMKGSLPRPVSGHFRVTSHFGANSISDIPGVSYDNPGIDVEVAKGATVTAVYPGTVSGIYMVPGYSTIIIINHDGYYTVYGNISKASVKVGDKVNQGHSLGKVEDDEDNPGYGMLHFEVWKNREKQNPAGWIK